MRTRNVSPRTLGGILAAATITSTLLGCPNQELAPLAPCTVSGVSLEVPQSGVDKVDLLFMIDNSGSMSEEQKKLSAVLPLMVKVLTTGNPDGVPSAAGMKPMFPPVQSLHIGVVSSDMGVNGAPAQKSCGMLSFIPTEQNTTTTNMFLNKPLGDDGQLQTSTAVAVAGIFAASTPGGPVAAVVPGDPACGSVQFPPGQRYIDFTAGVTNPEEAATKFGCIAKLGKNGCGLEQQLESVLKALTPPDNAMIKFTGNTNGNGTAISATGVSGVNGKFLREDAILAVVFVTDEEDCSIPDSSNAIFDATSQTIPGEINVRCGMPENQRYLHDVTKRYVAGIKALKPMAYQDRLIVASVVGIPVKANLGNEATHTGTAAIDMILAREDMKFKVQRNQAMTADEPVPTCISAKGDGSAAPARRFLELTKAFDQNGVVTSVCEDQYNDALKVVIEKIAAQLTGACLPRKLNPGADGKVACDVVEIKAAGSQNGCDMNKGRSERLPDRKVGNSMRVVCRMNQVPGGQGGEGWYYDETSTEVQTQCKRNPQRIAFTGNANPDPGAQAKFECFQPVASGVDEFDKNREAVNLGCKEDPLVPTAIHGDEKCNTHEAQTSGAVDLICVSGTCQIACSKLSDCPNGWVCTSEGGQNFCVNPTCPPAQQ
jgi:hypothetical protein